MPDCPNCSYLQGRLDTAEMDLEEHQEVLAELSLKLVDDADGFRKDIAAYREVAVMRQRGFRLVCQPDDRAVWRKDREPTVPAHELAHVVTMQIADAVHQAETDL